MHCRLAGSIPGLPIHSTHLSGATDKSVRKHYHSHPGAVRITLYASITISVSSVLMLKSGPVDSSFPGSQMWLRFLPVKHDIEDVGFWYS